MTLNDQLANIFSQIMNAERVGKQEVSTKGSVLVKQCLALLKENGYLTEIKEVKTQQGELLEITLKGTINNCNVIKPRFAVKAYEYEKFEKRYLPAKEFGILLVSTSQGLMTHTAAKEKNLGGRLIAYCY